MYLLYCLKYDYLKMEFDYGYFSQIRFSLKISHNQIKYQNLYRENIFDIESNLLESNTNENSWNRYYKNNNDYVKDFIEFINKIKDLSFNSIRNEEHDVCDGPSFVLKLGKHHNRFSYFGDCFDLRDSSYRDIDNLVREFVGKWGDGCFLPWKEND